MLIRVGLDKQKMQVDDVIIHQSVLRDLGKLSALDGWQHKVGG